jgi:hypothetical protein
LDYIYIGAHKAEGKCYVCKKTIHITDFDLGHNQAVAKGGKNKISNLRPICRTCNTSMGTMAIETFKAKYFGETPEKPKPVKRTTAKPAHKATVKKAPAKGISKPITKKTVKKPVPKKPVRRRARRSTNIWGL